MEDKNKENDVFLYLEHIVPILLEKVLEKVRDPSNSMVLTNSTVYEELEKEVYDALRKFF